MPELPEVHTTVEGLKTVLIGKTILDVWSDFHTATKHGKRQTIKNKSYFEDFKKAVLQSKIKSLERKGKNILINLDTGYTIIIHMKMTGHLMYGSYVFNDTLIKNKWQARDEGPLQDPFNQFIHLVFTLSNKKHLILSDMRRFASVSFFKTKEIEKHETVGLLGPDPLSPEFTAETLFHQLQKRKSWPIKSALLDQTLLAGIGNIYSDEILWETAIHPLSITGEIPKKKIEEIFVSMQKILKFSIAYGGDSKSDYRNAFGEKGGFQNFHKVYGRKKETCQYPQCKSKRNAIIERVVIKGRSSHFCPVHQKLYGSTKK